MIATAIIPTPHLSEDTTNLEVGRDGEGLEEASETSSESLWERLHREAVEAVDDEPEMRFLLNSTILAPGVNSFEEAVAMTVAFRLLGQSPCSSSSVHMTAPSSFQQQQQPLVFCPHALYGILKGVLQNENERVMGIPLVRLFRRMS